MSYNITHIYPEGPSPILVRGVGRVRVRVRYYFWSGSGWGSVPVVVHCGSGVGSSPCPYRFVSWVVSLGSVAGTVCKGPSEGPSLTGCTWNWSWLLVLGPTDPIDLVILVTVGILPILARFFRSCRKCRFTNFLKNFPNSKFFMKFSPVIK